MDPNVEVLDISSDEEDTPGCVENLSFDNFEWISDFLNEDVGKSDDSDDVVVIGEMRGKQNVKSSTVADNDGDDDCVILDDDPDKPVSVFEEAASQSDELLVVGEKGQIACRDYPHARHLCAKFPFGTTPHVTYCDQCHCFVCDSLAPCVYWGTGSSSTDHCHATDKEKIWKHDRKNAKIELHKLLPLPVPKFPHTSLSMNQFPLPKRYNSMPKNPISSHPILRPCSSSTNFDVPNIISQSRNQRAGPVFSKNRLPSHEHSLGVRNKIIRKPRSVGNTGHRFVPPPPIYKKAAVNPLYSPVYNVNLPYAPQCSRNFNSVSVPVDNNLNHISIVNFQSQLMSNIENPLPMQPRVNSQPTAQPHHSQNINQQEFQNLSSTDCLFDIPSQSNQQAQVQQNGPVQSAEQPVKEDPSVVPDSISHIPGTGVNLTSLYFDFEDWLLENQAVTVIAQATTAPFDPNISSDLADFFSGKNI